MARDESVHIYKITSSLDSRSPARATSPTFSSTTNASQIDVSSVDTIITRKDLRKSTQAYDDLIASSAAYRKALMDVSKASSEFASAMHSCSRLKGVTDEAGVNLQAAGGLHYLMGNHWDVLAHTLEQQFEDPLRLHLSQYKAAAVERSVAYERALLEKSKIIKRTESENLHYGRRKQRDLQSFRRTLSILQAQLDDLDRLKAEHYQQVLEHEEEVWDVVAGKVCLVVRSSLDIFDRVTAKASDSILETMVQSIPDPFDSYGPPKKEGQLFSILAPLAMTPDTESNSDSQPQWAHGLGVSFPRTEPLPTGPDGMGRLRRHSAPMSPSSSSTSTLTPSSTRRTAFPTILTVIDENRKSSEDSQHTISTSTGTTPDQHTDNRNPKLSVDAQSPPPPPKATLKSPPATEL